MSGKVLVLGKSLPVWVIAAALIVATAGAAAGTVLSGGVAGQVSTTVSQSLSIASGSVSGADNAILTISDDGTGFSSAAEINNGDEYTIALFVANDSSQTSVYDLNLVGPSGVGLAVDGAVRTSASTWKGSAVSTGDPTQATLTITVAAADELAPGYYSIEGSLKQVSN